MPPATTRQARTAGVERPFRSVANNSSSSSSLKDTRSSPQVATVPPSVIARISSDRLVTDDEMNTMVNDNFLHRVPEILVDLANERGGADNITAVVAYVIDERELLGQAIDRVEA